jgi:hypothetical protein
MAQTPNVYAGSRALLLIFARLVNLIYTYSKYTSSLKLHGLEKTTGPRTVGFLLTRFFCKCPRRKVAKANKITPLPDSGGGLENRRSATLNKTEVCRYNGLCNRCAPECNGVRNRSPHSDTHIHSYAKDRRVRKPVP